MITSSDNRSYYYNEGSTKIHSLLADNELSLIVTICKKRMGDKIADFKNGTKTVDFGNETKPPIFHNADHQLFQSLRR